MKLKLKDIADYINGKITGDENVEIERLAKIENAKKNELTFLYHKSFEKYLESTQATAVIVKSGVSKNRSDLIYIETEKPDRAFHEVLKKFFTPPILLSGINCSSFIHESAVIGNNVAIGKNVVISAECVIKDNTRIFHNTVLFENVKIGSDCVIFPNVTIRENCVVGDRVLIHSGAAIGSDGFGYAKNEKGEYEKIPQIGNVVIEDDVEIGSNAAIDRAALGSTIIKKGAKIDNLVQIGHNVYIGENTAISGQAGVSGSTKIGKNCILAGQAGIADHLEVADNVIITAQSGVSKSITKSGIYFGSPTKEHKLGLKLEAHIRNLPNYADKISILEKQIEELKKNYKNKQ